MTVVVSVKIFNSTTSIFLGLIVIAALKGAILYETRTFASLLLTAVAYPLLISAVLLGVAAVFRLRLAYWETLAFA